MLLERDRLARTISTPHKALLTPFSHNSTSPTRPCYNTPHPGTPFRSRLPYTEGRNRGDGESVVYGVYRSSCMDHTRNSPGHRVWGQFTCRLWTQPQSPPLGCGRTSPILPQGDLAGASQARGRVSGDRRIHGSQATATTGTRPERMGLR